MGGCIKFIGKIESYVSYGGFLNIYALARWVASMSLRILLGWYRPSNKIYLHMMVQYFPSNIFVVSRFGNSVIYIDQSDFYDTIFQRISASCQNNPDKSNKIPDKQKSVVSGARAR